MFTDWTSSFDQQPLGMSFPCGMLESVDEGVMDGETVGAGLCRLLIADGLVQQQTGAGSRQENIRNGYSVWCPRLTDLIWLHWAGLTGAQSAHMSWCSG